MEMKVEDKICWVCGKPFINNHPRLHKTDHHTLPKRLRPKNNVIVPVCKKCHEFINQEDVRGMYAFAYKIDKSVGELRNMAKEFFDTVSSKFKKHARRENNGKIKTRK